MRVLAGLAVEDVDLTRLSSRKARRVLARLAVARAPRSRPMRGRRRVGGTRPPSNPATTLGAGEPRARDARYGADHPYPARLHARGDWLDLTALAELTPKRVAARRRRGGSRLAAALAALELLRGPFGPRSAGPSWSRRTGRRDRHASTARLVAAEAALAGGDPWHRPSWPAARWTRSRTTSGTARVMSAHERAGRPALALKAYAEAAERSPSWASTRRPRPRRCICGCCAEPVPPSIAAVPLAGRAGVGPVGRRARHARMALVSWCSLRAGGLGKTPARRRVRRLDRVLRRWC